MEAVSIILTNWDYFFRQSTSPNVHNTKTTTFVLAFHKKFRHSASAKCYGTSTMKRRRGGGFRIYILEALDIYIRTRSHSVCFLSLYWNRTLYLFCKLLHFHSVCKHVIPIRHFQSFDVFYQWILSVLTIPQFQSRKSLT